MLAYAVASVLMGGGYWSHYLVELVPAVALATGLMAGHRLGLARALTTLVVTAALCSWTFASMTTKDDSGALVGQAIQRSARAGDTIVSAFGNANIVTVSGLSSPYPFLWSLPARTLDPHMSVLRSTLRGPAAPTWFVVRGTNTLARLRSHHVEALLVQRYHRVGEVCGRTVYLHRGRSRTRLRAPVGCSAGTAAPSNHRRTAPLQLDVVP
jgi:hypothetical protein